MDIEKAEVRKLLHNKGFVDELIKKAVSDTKLLRELAEDIVDELTDHFEGSFEIKALLADEKLLKEAIRRAAYNKESIEKLVGDLEYNLSSLEKVTRELKETNLKLREANIRLKKTQDQLVQSEKLAVAGRLVASVAHELNNPLGTIKGLAQMVQREMKKEDPKAKDLKTVEEEARRAQQILKRLQTFARPKELEVELIDVNKTIDKALLLLDRQISLQNIKIEKSYHPNLPKITADPNQLKQVFLNVVLNASQTIPEDREGRIQIKTNDTKIKGKKYIEIEFTDNGCGIPRKDIPRIFEPFFTTKEVGTGLGLAICRSIVERHHGKITVKSKVEEGSTFLIKLPISTR